MGSSSSRAARKLPKRSNPPWAGARVPDPSTSEGLPLASELKSEGIEKNSADPDFLLNLNRLGPVRVDQHMQAFRPPDQMKNASAGDQFLLSTTTLSELLEERKKAKTRVEVVRMAEKYGVDIEKLESVARFVSSPSVEAAGERWGEGSGEEGIEVVKAVWIEPRLDERPPERSGHL